MDIREEAINRVLRIVDQFSRKLRISIGLPHYLEKMTVENNLDNHNLEKEFQKLHKLYTDYKRINSLENDEESSEETNQLVVYDSKRLNLDSLWLIGLESLMNEFQYETYLVINDSFNDISPSLRNIVYHVELLKQIVERQMKTTPKRERERKADLRNAETLIAITRDEIEKLRTNFADQTKKHNDVVQMFTKEINSLNSDIDKITTKHNEEFDREMSCYKTTLSTIIGDIREEEKNLENQLAAHESLLENLIQINLEQEKLLREQCLGSEKQLLTARSLYDRDLSKLTELKETLESQVFLTKEHYRILKDEFSVQDALYLNLKKERELALMKAFAERIDNFEKNRAARIIQRTWRAYHERITSKKKKRSRRKNN